MPYCETHSKTALAILLIAYTFTSGCKREIDRPSLDVNSTTTTFVSWDKSALPAADKTNIEGIVNRLTAALTQKNANAAAALFDPQRMTAVLKNTIKTKMMRRDIRSIETAIPQAINQAMTNLISVGYWSRHEPRSVMISNDGKDAVLLIRIWTTDDIGGSVRLWFSKDAGNWSIYDYEELETGLSMLTAMQVAVDAGAKNPMVLQAITQYAQIMAAIAESDNKTADQLLTGISQTPLPPKFEGLRLMATGAVRLEQGRYSDALVALRKAEALQVDIPIIHYLMASALNELGRHDEALKHAQTYNRFVGADSGGCYEMGVAHLKLGQRDKAIDAFRKGLADTPADWDLIWGLGRALSPESMSEIGTHYLKLKDGKVAFDSMCFLFELDKNYAAIEALVEARYQQAPNDPEAMRFDAAVKKHRKEWEALASLAKKALGMGDDSQNAILWHASYATAMINQGKSREAVNDAEDPKQTYRHIADALMEKLEAGEGSAAARLKSLTKWHMNEHPTDPWPYFFKGKLQSRRKAVDSAHRAFRRAAELATDNPFDSETIKKGWMKELIKADRFKDAYAKIEPQRATFDSIALLLLQDTRLDDLKSLIEQHQKSHPDDLEIQYYRVELAATENRHTDALHILDSQREALINRSYGPWWFFTSRIRSLLALQRYDDAQNEAREAGKKMSQYDEDYLNLWIAAAKGNIEDAIINTGKLLTTGDTIDLIYESEEFGALLRSDSMTAYREHYPPPKN